MATTKKTAKTTKKVEAKAPTALRKGTLAYLGLYGFAAERATKRVEQIKALYTNTTDGLFEDLIARGEKVEELALETAKTAQKRAADTFETTTDKVKAVVPFGSNDRVEELQAEIQTLNKKISALSKKAAKPRRKASTTQKTGINKAIMATEKTAPKAA